MEDVLYVTQLQLESTYVVAEENQILKHVQHVRHVNLVIMEFHKLIVNVTVLHHLTNLQHLIVLYVHITQQHIVMEEDLLIKHVMVVIVMILLGE